MEGSPKWIENRCLEYQYTKLGTQTYFGRWTPQVIEQRCLEYQYTKIGRQTYFGQWTPQWIKDRCLEYQYTKLGRQTYFGRWTPWVLEHRCLEYQYTKLGRQTYFGRWTLLGNWAEMSWIPVHKTWQMNILWLMDRPVQCIIGYILWDVFDIHFGFFKKRWEFPFISE